MVVDLRRERGEGVRDRGKLETILISGPLRGKDALVVADGRGINIRSPQCSICTYILTTECYDETKLSSMNSGYNT